MARSTIYTADGLQAARLPEEAACPEDLRDVTAPPDDTRRTMVPPDSRWSDVFDAPGIDLGERDQLEAQAREQL